MQDTPDPIVPLTPSGCRPLRLLPGTTTVARLVSIAGGVLGYGPLTGDTSVIRQKVVLILSTGDCTLYLARPQSFRSAAGVSNVSL
jgi:hypothetical protein